MKDDVKNPVNQNKVVEPVEDDKKKEFSLTVNDLSSSLRMLISQSVDDYMWFDYFIEPKIVIIHTYADRKDHHYKQSYTIGENDEVTLVNDRTEVFMHYLTKDEEDHLNAMRDQLDEANAQVAMYQKKENDSKKQELITSQSYASISDTDEFKAIVSDDSKETFDAMSADELAQKLDAIVLKYAKEGKLNFAKHDNDDTNNTSMKRLPLTKTVKSKGRYGNFV